MMAEDDNNTKKDNDSKNGAENLHCNPTTQQKTNPKKIDTLRERTYRMTSKGLLQHKKDTCLIV